ncbi:NAD-dependent epimerase/dehydratase family protein [Ensifer adhaerens]|uniref:NAD-dependent epimerase/dehydratase family protein n=1 Tax=Ensifer adhaerens TaxID=106592 RepID=UPI00098EB013|nr:NAD-dependent epimerase/dehydratase family protein [Ensifer adhaerens]
MPRAVIVGGTGQIGLATARYLVDEAWDVTIISRHATTLPGGCRHAEVDARDVDGLRAVIGTGTDVLLSCVAFDATDGECLAQAGASAGRIVAISSASVYRDGEGRTLDEAPDCGFPVFPIPLTEESPIVAAGTETYSTRKAAMESTLLSRAACPVTILRPCAIHGPESRHAREWWFVRRLLDGRTAIPLAYGGRSRFQTTSVAAIASAVLQAAGGHLPAIANVSEADSPTVAEIGHAIMSILDVRAELIGLPDAPAYPPAFGATPWSIPSPMVVAGVTAPAATYKRSVEPAIRWLVEHVNGNNWRERLPQLAAYPYDHFDYETDDRALALAGGKSIGF